MEQNETVSPPTAPHPDTEEVSLRGECGITYDEISQATQKDRELGPLWAYHHTHILPNDQAARARVKRMALFTRLVDERLMYAPSEGMPHRVCLPLTLRRAAMAHCHDHPLSGHMGMDSTAARVTERFYWHGMLDDIRHWVASCTKCRQKGQPHHLTTTLPLPTHCSMFPFDMVGVDTVGPLPLTKNGNKYIIVIVDHYSHWPEAWPVPDERAETIIQTIYNGFVTRHGAPNILLTDQGKNYLSKATMQLYAWLGIDKRRTTAYHPQANGRVERFNRTLKEMLAKYANERQDDWDEYIPGLLFAYRTRPHRESGYTPFYVVNGREAKEPVYMEFGLDRNPHYAVGDFVDLYVPEVKRSTAKKFALPWHGPYVVVKVDEKRPDNVLIRRNNVETLVHKNRLRPHITRHTK